MMSWIVVLSKPSPAHNQPMTQFKEPSVEHTTHPLKNVAWKHDSEENITCVKYVPHPDAWESIRWPVAKVIDSRVWKIRWISAESFQTIITVFMVISLFSPYQEMHKRSFLWLHRWSQVLFEPEPHLSFYYLLLCDFPTSQLQPFTGTQTAARQIRICQNQTNFPKYLNWRAVKNHGQCCRHPERLASGRMPFLAPQVL